MTLDEIFDHGKSFARFAFDDQGAVHPMWIMENDEGKTLPVAAPMEAMENKDGLVAAVRKILIKERAVRYVSMLEAWMVVAKSDKEAEKVLNNLDITPVREHPNRQEVVMIVAEDKHHQRSGYYFIIRPKEGKPYLSHFKETSGSEEMGGRFINLMDSAQSIQ